MGEYWWSHEKSPNHSLMPFAGGVDRAKLLGFESAEAFAKRKLAEEAIILSSRTHSPETRARRSAALREWHDKKRQGKLSANSAMPQEMHVEHGSPSEETMLDIPIT